MRRWTLLVLVFALAGCKRGGSPAPEPQAALPLLEDGGVDLGKGAISAPEVVLPSLAPLVERVSATVVSLSVLGTSRMPPGHERFFGALRPPRQEKGGSAFIVDRSGLVVTNNHVVEGAEQVTVRLLDRREFKAKVVGTDPNTDVAVLKIDAKNLPPMALGNSDDARVGEWVLAIGNPLGEGLTFTVTSGIVSAKGRALNGLPRA